MSDILSAHPNENFLAIDFETATHSRDSACSVGLVRVERNEIVHKEVHFIKPPTRDFRFSWVHGITWQDVAQAPTFQRLWPKIASHFQDIDFIAAHNAQFDKSVLHACCLTAEIPAPTLPFLCTMKLAREKWNLRPTKLSDVARHLDIPLNHHEALSDALACAKIVIAARQEKQEEAQVPPSAPSLQTSIGKVLIRRAPPANSASNAISSKGAS